MNTLYIDTSDNKNVYTKLVLGENEFIARSSSSNSRPDSIVSLIEQVLKEAGSNFDEVDDIKVNRGPGSYTGLKVGVSVANALSFSLGKKVNGFEFGNLIDVKYE